MRVTRSIPLNAEYSCITSIISGGKLQEFHVRFHRRNRTPSSYVVFWDTPVSTRLDFMDAGRINQNGHPIGTYLQDHAFHVSILLDLPNNHWTISEDSNQLFSGTFFEPYPAHPNPPTGLRDIRFNLADSGAAIGSPFAAIDNIRISGSQSVPEPTTLFFCIISAFGLIARRR